MKSVGILLAAFLSGCAGVMQMSENECRGADWYEVGERDGVRRTTGMESS